MDEHHKQPWFKREEQRAMKHAGFVILFLSVLGLILPQESIAQRGMKARGSGGWGMASPYGRMYDLKTVETIQGEVISVERITPMTGMAYGVHLMVRTGNGILSIHLGPEWYLEKQDFMVAPKDRVEITGSRVTFNDEPAIIASTLRRGDDTLQLRNENGVPFWSGWRRE